MQPPKVSVIIPVYNVEKYLRECLESVANQTLKEIEIICIDDGSTDNSLEILKEYAKKDSRFIIIEQENSGAGVARNVGLRIAGSKYFAFMDPDDFYPDNNVLSKLYLLAEKHNVLVCGGSLVYCDNDGKPIRNPFEKSIFTKDTLMTFYEYQFDYYYQRFIYSTKFLKDNNLFFPPYRRYQDPPFFINYMALAKNFYAIKDATYSYRSSRKASAFNVIQATDMLKGIKVSLELSKKYNYEFLHSQIVERVNNNYFTTILRDIISNNPDVGKQLEDTLSSIDYSKKFTFNDFLISYTKYPRVSLIIPIYNVEKYLRKCLDSAVNQTLKEIEIICVNDGSTDNSLQIVEEYAKKDSRIVIINQKNGGLSASRNSGLDIAKSKYIMFIDSDDWIELDTLETCYNAIVSEDVDLVIGNLACIAEDETLLEWRDRDNKYYATKQKQKGRYEFKGDFTEYRTCACCKLYKKEIIDKYGLRFPKGLINEDEAWHWYYFSVIKYVYFTDGFSYNRLMRGNSIMHQRNFNNVGKLDLIFILKHIYDYLQKNGLYTKYQNQFGDYSKRQVNAVLWRCGENKKLSEEAKKNIQKVAKKCNIQLNAEANKSSVNLLKQLFSVYNETNHKVIKILGLKIKLRKEKIARFKNSSTKFLEKIFSAKNENVYKVIRLLGIKFKFKSRYRVLLNALELQQKQLEKIKQDIEKILQTINSEKKQ